MAIAIYFLLTSSLACIGQDSFRTVQSVFDDLTNRTKDVAGLTGKPLGTPMYLTCKLGDGPSEDRSKPTYDKVSFILKIGGKAVSPIQVPLDLLCFRETSLQKTAFLGAQFTARCFEGVQTLGTPDNFYPGGPAFAEIRAYGLYPQVVLEEIRGESKGKD